MTPGLDMNWILGWLVGAGTLVAVLGTLSGLLRAPAGMPATIGARAALLRGDSTFLVNLAVLAILAAASVLAPDIAGYLGLGAWALLLLAPGWLARLLAQLVVAERFRLAARTAALIRLLHPFGQWRYMALLLDALATARAGNRDAALARLDAVAQAAATPLPLARAAAAYAARIDNDWERLLRVPAGQDDASIITMRLRALGEVGRPGALVTVFEAIAAGRTSPANLALAKLHLFAFTGRRDALDRLLRTELRRMPAETARFWRATVDLAAGIDARPALTALATGAADPGLRQAARRRLADPPSVPDLGPRAEAVIRAADAARGPTAPLAAAPAAAGTPISRAPATLALIAINLAVFALELATPGDQDAMLYRLGGLVPRAVLAGEWWRVVAALFLHAGVAHIGFNMLALVVIGPQVEAPLGSLRFLLVYFTAGIGSMLTIVALTQAGIVAPDITIGASGAIMGLVGAAGAVMILAWARARTRDAARRFGGILLVVVMQTAFDLATPEISMTGHLSGAGIGFVVGLVLATVPRRQRI